jgi:hypothetical protein
MRQIENGKPNILSLTRLATRLMTNAHGKTKGKRWGRPQRSPWFMLRKREIVELKLREKSKLVLVVYLIYN